MTDHEWNILLVEDDEDDFILTREMLAEARGSVFVVDWASSYEEGKQKIISRAYDAILMDYELGSQTGLDLIREVTALGCRSPIILLTGRGNFDVDLNAMNSGAIDYLSKSEATPHSLERSIRYAMLQKQTEDVLLRAKEDLETQVRERTHELTWKNIALETEITERKRIQTELAEVQRRLIDRAEAERLEIARELHDGPMQELYGIVFQMDTLQAEVQSEEAAKTVAQMKENLLKVIHSLRTMSRELRPPALAPYGLEKAIHSHAESLRAIYPDLKIHAALDPDRQSLPEPVRLALYRIYQTAITNVVRHAKATEVSIRFSIKSNQVLLEIEDNGCGFQVPKRWIELAREGHLGLVGAVERAEAAGGKLEVISEPGKGTLVRVIVPRETPANGSPAP